MHLTKTLHTTDRKMTYFYGARALNEVFYLEDFLQIEKDFPNFTFHLALDRPDPAADAAGVKYTPGFVHQVIYETYLKNHRSNRRYRILHVCVLARFYHPVFLPSPPMEFMITTGNGKALQCFPITTL